MMRNCYNEDSATNVFKYTLQYYCPILHLMNNLFSRRKPFARRLSWSINLGHPIGSLYSKGFS